MNRTLLAVVVGAAGGVAATYYVMSGRAPAPAPMAEGRAPSYTPATARGADAAPLTATSGTAARASLYERAATSSVARLETLITEAAEQPASAERDFALGVLLTRYAEIDARQAVGLARDLELGDDVVAPLYGQWARMDPDDALEALSNVENRYTAADAGLAVLASLGDDATAIARVAAALARRDAPDAQTPSGPIGPFGPVSPWMAFPPAAAGDDSALGILAQRWARRDPRDALARVAAIGDSELRATFETAALREWARTEPDAMLASLIDVDTATQQRVLYGGGLRDLVRADPLRVLELAERLAEPLRAPIEQIALQTLSQQDALAALRYVERMPPGAQRQQLMLAIARGYGQQDPDAALAWARASGAQNNLLPSVVSGIAARDLDRAFDLLATLPSQSNRMMALVSVVMDGMRGADSDAAAMADRVRTLPAELRDHAWSVLLQTWASRSPEAAMDWLLSRGDEAPLGVFQQIGRQLALQDPETAASQTARVPSAARADWIAGVAMGYAQTDARAAVDWLAQFRGEPGYAASVLAAAPAVAQHDGAAGARLIDAIAELYHDRPEIRGAQARVANAWAEHDPAGAAEWALSLDDPDARSMVLANVAQRWALDDTDAARGWVFRQPPGDLRDAALHHLISATALSTGALDPTAVGAFSSQAAREQALMEAVSTAAARDPAEARRMIDYYIADPEKRAQAERMIDAARQRGAQPQAIIRFGVAPAINRPIGARFRDR